MFDIFALEIAEIINDLSEYVAFLSWINRPIVAVSQNIISTLENYCWQMLKRPCICSQLHYSDIKHLLNVYL